jgi:hypothetical protein
VGKAVTTLESELAVRLFQRSTRSLRLTEQGRAFHERCRHILDDLYDARNDAAANKEAPRGRVKVSAPIVTYHLLLPVLAEFLSLYPEIEHDLDFIDRIVDLIDEGVDVPIRSGHHGPARDLLIFKRDLGNANVTSLVERKSRYTVMIKNRSRHSRPIMDKIIDAFSALSAFARHSFAFDRGTVFRGFRALDDGVGARSWFCDPSAPWQKVPCTPTSVSAAPCQAVRICPTSLSSTLTISPIT